MADGDSVYSPYSDYAKLLKKKCSEESTESNSGCSGCNEGCSGCSEGCSGCKEECGCCPAGLVSIEDADGNNIGCLTPLDAEIYMARTYKCPAGFVKVTSGTGVAMVFVGCLTPAEYATYVAAIPA